MIPANRILVIASIVGSASAANAQELPVFETGQPVTAVQMNSLASSISANRHPVGSIIASVLGPAEFAHSAGDPSDFDLKTSGWTLADGKSVPGTRYAEVTNNRAVPDLRGVFLRGLNVDRSDGRGDPDQRKPGTYQSDSVKSHSHAVYPHAGKIIGRVKDSVPGAGAADTNENSRVLNAQTGDSGTAEETRPRNVAVYYYVRIN